jgi:hypothetical protein
MIISWVLLAFWLLLTGLNGLKGGAIFSVWFLGLLAVIIAGVIVLELMGVFKRFNLPQ